jgi:DNA-binding MarR family transcriptional regulator
VETALRRWPSWYVVAHKFRLADAHADVKGSPSASSLACCWASARRHASSLLMSLNRPQPAGMAAVASLLAMDRTTLTAALKPLERRGLVKITADPADGRSRLMTLTQKGRTLLARAAPVWEHTHKEVEGLVLDGDAERLRKDLRALST